MDVKLVLQREADGAPGRGKESSAMNPRRYAEGMPIDQVPASASLPLSLLSRIPLVSRTRDVGPSPYLGI